MKFLLLLSIIFCWYMKSSIAAASSETETTGNNPGNFYDTSANDLPATRRNTDRAFIRLGRSNPQFRLGRRSGDFSEPADLRFGQHGDGFIRFGKRTPQFIPALDGDSMGDAPIRFRHWPFVVDEDQDGQEMDIDGNFVRLGRANGFIRLGRSAPTKERK